MYLHIGQDWLVPHVDIIGIFQRTLLQASPDFRHLFLRLRSEGRVWGESAEAKTVILTDEMLYFTTISVHTLAKRIRQDWQYE